MKKIFTLLTALLCTVAQLTWAECVILQDDGTYQIQDDKFLVYNKTPKTFEIDNPRPTDTLTFSFSKSSSGVGGVTVTATYLDNTSETIISKSANSSQSYSSGGKSRNE